MPALVRGDELITATGKIGARIREAQAIEAEPGGLSAAMFWGNPFTDVPDLCSHSLVVTDGDAELGVAGSGHAGRSASGQDRAAMQAALLLRRRRRSGMANEATGTVVLIDAADATSSGASGDSNAVLSALIDYGYRGRALFPIVDAPAVKRRVRGGRRQHRPHHARRRRSIQAAFSPLPVEASVRMLSRRPRLQRIAQLRVVRGRHRGAGGRTATS